MRRVVDMGDRTMRVAVALVENEKFLCRVEDDVLMPFRSAAARSRADLLIDAITDGTDLEKVPTIAAPLCLADATLCPPLSRPTKILCIGANYRDHAAESDVPVPAAPLLFAKYPNTLIGDGAPLAYDPSSTGQLDYEAELAVIIGRRATAVPSADALSHVYGYTCANDISARDAQLGDGQWVRGKSFDNFCPLGPWVVTADEIADPQALSIQLRVNGELLQNASTSDMVFTVADIISYLSTYITLEPGDLVLTGTPAGVGMARKPPRWLADGDAMDVTISGIGHLRNEIVARR